MTQTLSRRAATRHLLRPLHLRDSLTLARQPSLRNAALAGSQAALTLAIALPLVHLSPWHGLTGFAALGALVALFGRFAPEGQRARVLLQSGALQVLAVLSMSLAVWLGLSANGQLTLLALASGVLFFATTTWRLGPPGVLIFVFAAGAAMGHPVTLPEIFGRVAATGLVAVLAWAVCTLTEVLRHAAGPDRPLPVEPVRPLGHRLTASARVVLGAGIAAFASDMAGAAHPAWAAMGAIVVIQGPFLHVSMSRALQRMAGTVAGALLVWLILQADPSFWVLIAVLAMLQITTELIIGTNYGLGQILVTPMALLMSYLAMPQASGAAMASERVLDTLAGVVIGMLVAIVLSTLDDRAHLARHHDARMAG